MSELIKISSNYIKVLVEFLVWKTSKVFKTFKFIILFIDVKSLVDNSSNKFKMQFKILKVWKQKALKVINSVYFY